MELYFTIEQLKRLEKYENHFRTITKGHYKYSTTISENNEISDIYESVKTTEKIQRNWSCSTCTYRAWEKVANLYYKSIQQLKETQHGEDTERKERGETKNKRGRKKTNRTV